MSYVTAVLAVITAIIVALWRAASSRQKRRQLHKNQAWNQKLDDLINAYKKYKK